MENAKTHTPKMTLEYPTSFSKKLNNVSKDVSTRKKPPRI
jgi:hypothetical protein